MKLNEITKKEEGVYNVSSLSCPDCKGVLTLEIGSDKLFRYNQGALISEVLAEFSADQRERFISGYCGDCWKKIFG
jgi:hypothetical protein